MKLNNTYTILEEIGSGGGGVVYKAYHERLKTDVVVKQIKERVKGKLESRAEADILKNMKHTYLPRVYDFLEIDGEIYTVMDFIPGESLDKAIAREGRFSQKQVLKWANQLAEALDYLHSQNPPVIHSDIKPANIMLTPDGDICLIDFNISLALDSSMKYSTGVSAGYSPPEQYKNLSFYSSFTQTQKRPPEKVLADNAATATAMDTVTATATVTAMDTATATATVTAMATTTSTAVDTSKNIQASINSADTTAVETELQNIIGRGIDMRSDIYSLGATLYHLLTGIKPDCNFAELKPLSQCDVEISEGFQHIIEKMMEFLPEKRYQSGSELLYALRHIQDLDSEYVAWKRKQRLKRCMVAGVFAVGAVLTVCGKTMINNEQNIAYNQYMIDSEQAIEAGNFDMAADTLQKAEQLLPKRAEAYSKNVLLLYEREEYANCISYGEEILRNAPYQLADQEASTILSNIYYVLGNAYVETEDYGNAVANLEKALSLCQDNSLYYRDYAIALAKTGNIDLAESELQHAVDMGLGEDSIYMVQGEIAYAKEYYEEASELLKKVISFSDSDSLRKRAVLLCDKAYRELGSEWIDQDIELLETEENRYADSSVSTGSITERLADAYTRKAETSDEIKKEYYQKALDKFNSLYESGYVTARMMENIAILYEQLNQYDQAEAILLQMSEKYPDSYIPYKRLAFLEADRQQQKANAEREYQTMKNYYEKASELYEGQNTDQEMQMLEVMLQELKDGNWF